MLILHQHHAADHIPLGHKVTFDGVNKLILINSGTRTINVEQDLYSDWKEWSRIPGRTNLRFEYALRTEGGSPTVGGDRLGAAFFLTNGWQIRTWEDDHTLTLDGDLFVDGGGDVFVPTLFPHNILILQQVSNIVDKVTLSGETATNIAGSVWSTSISSPAAGTYGEAISNIDTNVTIAVDSLVAASTIVTAGSTRTKINTNLTQSSAFFDGMLVQVFNSAGVSVRQVNAYNSTNGAITFNEELPFDPDVGDQVYVLARHSSIVGFVR